VRTDRTLSRLDRLFSRLDREPERPAHGDVPKMCRHRFVLLAVTLGLYLAIVWAVSATSRLVRLDWQLMFFRPYQQWPQLHGFADHYVVLGQRGPTAVLVAAWLGWRSWRQHILRPLLALGVSLLLLNITVGAAKIGMGRLGPHYATVIGSNEMGLGGSIFPSGHTANAVVTWGVLAYLASTPTARRRLSALSATLALGVGLTTVYLGTHWLSDVLLGWAAGLLVLLALPLFEPLIARAEVWIIERFGRLRTRWRATGGHRAPAPALDGSPVVLVWRLPAGKKTSPRDTISATARASRAPVRPAPCLRTPCSERTPTTPAGSRRPPRADGVPGGTSPAARRDDTTPAGSVPASEARMVHRAGRGQAAGSGSPESSTGRAAVSPSPP
jgi:membrane-associated phospholipid phosphatase